MLKEIIRRSLSIASKPPLSDFELETTANDWFFVVGSKVPISRLDDADRKAFEIHNSPYPLHPNELCYAWEVIKNEEKDSAVCTFENYHEKDFDEALIKRAAPDFMSDILIPCPKCRKDESNEAWSKIVTEFKLNQSLKIITCCYPSIICLIPLEPVDPVVITEMKIAKITKPLSPLEILDKEIKENNAEFFKTPFNNQQKLSELYKHGLELFKQRRSMEN